MRRAGPAQIFLGGKSSAPSRARRPQICLAGKSGGFTLMEILVSIAIIAVLAGLLFPAIGAARRNAATKTAKATIERLKLACQGYEADFGDFPPTTIGGAGVGTNGVNEGIESLVRCLTTKKEHGPYLDFEEKDLVNTDGDALAGKDPAESTIQAKTLFELADPWGNPYVYYHNRDYKDAGGGRLGRYILASGERVECRPRPSGKTERYPDPTKFVVWSIGADGKNENGEGDDVCSWK